MATYTITINERTKEGKGLLHYLQSLGVLTPASEGKEISATMKKKIDEAIKRYNKGEYKEFKTAEEMKQYLDSL